MRVGVLGAGSMGATVIGHLQGCDRVGSIVAYDICPKRVSEMEKNYNITATTNLEEVLSDREVKLIFVTASNEAHRELSLRAMEAGKAVMCEKPIATTLADARQMVETAEAKGVFLQIGFELRYSRLYTKVKEWIDRGLLGEVVNSHCYYISSEFFGKDSWRITREGSGGMFSEKLCHYVDLPRWWTGSRVTDVISVCAPNVIPFYEVRDNYHTTYRFENGAVGQLTFMMAPGAVFTGDPLQNFVDQQQGDGHNLRFLVVGTEGVAETDVFNRSVKRWEFRDGPRYFESHWVENLAWGAEEDHIYFHNTLDQTRDIVHRVAEGLPPATPARDAYETMKLVFAAELSADSGERVILDELGE